MVASRPAAVRRDCHARPIRRAGLTIALLLAGCGSADEQPPAATPPASPPLNQRPAGRVEPGAPPPADPAVERRAGRLELGGRSVRTCREPVAAVRLDQGRRVAVLCVRDRVLEVYHPGTLKRLARVRAGIGPARLAADGGNLLFVTDPVGQAVLVFHLHPRFELIRRVVRRGGPWGIAFDERRGALWITLPQLNRLAEYVSGARPVRRGFRPAIRAARDVTVAGDRVTVYGHGERQVLDLPRTR